jgi:hypothetical protein
MFSDVVKSAPDPIGGMMRVTYIWKCDLRFPTGHSIPGALLDL